jgi:Calx-beta domain
MRFPLRRRRKRLAVLGAALVLAAIAAPTAQAQITPPPVNLPQLPRPVCCLPTPAPPTVLLPNVSIQENDDGAAPIWVNFALSKPNPYNRPVSVLVSDHTQSYGTATPGADYVTFAPFRVTWQPGQRVAKFPVTLLGDTVAEAADEVIDIRITSPDGVDIADNDADVGIHDNDPHWTTLHGSTPVTLLANNRIFEGDRGCAPVEVSVHLTRKNTGATPISVLVSDYTALTVGGSNPPRTFGTATPGVDYVSFAPFRLQFPSGATQASFPITICGDTTVEPEEHINVRITGPQGVDIQDNDLSLYLRADD